MVSCSSDEKKVTNSQLELQNSNKKVVSQDITLEEISSYLGDVQKEIYRALSPENKKRLWLEKFEILLNITSDSNEYLLMKRIYDEIHKIDFEEALMEDEEDATLNGMIEEGILNFGWDDTFVDITFSSFEFYEVDKVDYNAYKHTLTQHIDDGGGSGGSSLDDCTCKNNSLLATCKKGCKETIDGCGLLWRKPCIGKYIYL